ncbi:MAG: glycosyltransferase family 2 protein [Bacteroidales bacterium]
MNHPFISVISPVYGCKSCLYELCFRLKETLEKITQDFEIILVNDVSPDGAWETIIELAQKDSRVKGINLSRNFGQHYAITAGLDNCNGEWVVVMDCDLQDQPEEILKLYNKALEGYDIVFGRRFARKDHFFKKFFSKLFYFFFSYLTDTKQDYTVANFGIFHKKVIQAILNMGDYYRVFPILIQWVGFKKTYIDVEHGYRNEGKSGYSYRQLIRLAFDMIVSFSEKPLRLGLKFGILISFVSFLMGLYYLIQYLTGKVLVPGYTSLIITIMFSTGIIISFLGLVGVYIGKVSIQVKNRPKYIVKQKINIELYS